MRKLHGFRNDAIPLDLLKSEQQKIAKQLAAIDHQIKAHDFTFSEMQMRLTDALDLVEDCGTTYRQAGDHIKKLLNQTIFSRLLVGEDGRVEPEFAEPFDMLVEAANSVEARHRQECGSQAGGMENRDVNNAEIRGTSVLTDFLSSTSNHLSNFFGQGWITNFLVGVTELQLILRGLLYYYDANNVCLISYKLIQLIPEKVDAEPYLSVCMDEVYENYRYTYCELAKQQGNNYGKWGEELTKRILECYQEFARKQNVAYSKPDLQTSIENRRLIIKANSEQNARINKTAREKNFFSSMFQSRIMKYGKRHAAIQYTKRDEYSYIVTPYASIKHEREIPYVYTQDPVNWYCLRKHLNP